MTLNSNRLTGNLVWPWLRFAMAGVLGVAAVAKIVNWAQILAGDGILADRPLLLSVIGLEAVVATSLCLASPQNSWRLAVLVFSVLAASAGYAVFSGRECNCISESISPRLMLLLDLTMLVLAFVFRPSADDGTSNTTEVKLRPIRAVICFVAGIAFVCAALFREHGIAEQIGRDSSAPLQFLIADMLIGNEWPIRRQHHPELAAIESGRWLVVVVRRDCAHCRELLANVFSDPNKHRPDERTVVFLAGDSTWPFQFDSVSLHVGSKTMVRWPVDEPFVASPAIFLVDEGKITNAADGDAAGEFCNQLFSK